jgi:isoleucyl-tRNA synthetase
MSFKPVSSQVDFVSLEQDILQWWSDEQIVQKYLSKNDQSKTRYSFLDGPMTANNPMGVHHAWGRTYKDLFQRFHNLLGDKQRFQNGFDEQGLWVEVEVEKELDLHSKKDILNLVPGDEFASLEKFINLCKERVAKYSAVQTEQSQRLGYFMDWSHSYHTSSAANNYEIWHFLQVCQRKGWLYKGHDSVPWCPRCGTAISQMEILTEDYKEVSHESVYFKLPLAKTDQSMAEQSLLVWTTTPWTIPANVAVAVNPEFDYVLIETDKGLVWLTKEANDRLELGKVREAAKGAELVGWQYAGPFDHLPAVQVAANDQPLTFHTVVAAKDLVVEGEGTGLVHLAPGAGGEDFKIAKEQGLSVIAPIDEGANYVEDFGQFSGQNAKKHPELIIDYLQNQDGGQYLFKTERYKHRYPICWRCKTELVWRVVDEWYIAVDRPDESGQTYREQMIETARAITWLPKWGLDRELDWLKNMSDWLISKKRFWGLALPIYEDSDGSFIVVGSYEELKELAVEGWSDFDGHTPHRPWIDQVKIKSPKTGAILSRIPDVGNPWLDAGIVPFSTMPADWFPADFIVESFPGQFKNWFYALIAMSTALKAERAQTVPFRPYKTVLGFATVRDEKGQEMHKSKGNSIEFNAAAEQVGAEAMRWQYVTANPENNLNFGFGPAKEIQRRFFLIWWNVYNFFVTYANLDGWTVNAKTQIEYGHLPALDQWILAQLEMVRVTSTDRLAAFDAMTPSRLLEKFIVSDLSGWYIRRSRDRVGPTAEDEADKAAFYQTAYQVLTTVSALASPYLPFISDAIYSNLTGGDSVHVAACWPHQLIVAANGDSDDSTRSLQLRQAMAQARLIVEAGHAARESQSLKLKQPLAKAVYNQAQSFPNQCKAEIEGLIAAELNVLKVEAGQIDESLTSPEVVLDTAMTDELKAMGQARELVRAIQAERKRLGVKLNDRIVIQLPEWPESQVETIKRQTLANELTVGDTLKVSVVDGSA